MEPTTEQLAAGSAKGLSPAMCARLQGTTPEELSADADTFLTEFPASSMSPVFRVGGRGADIAGGNGQGTLGYGAALYRERHGLDEDGNRPAPRPVVTDSRTNPFFANSYMAENA
ncbi:hypothetical protein [Streptomyces humi]